MINTHDHLSIKERKNSGVHYTPAILASFVANQIVNSLQEDTKSKNIKILDPAIGDGQLILALIETLREKGYKNFSISGFDTDGIAIKNANRRISELYPDLIVDLKKQNFLDLVIENYSNDNGGLFRKNELTLYDIIISNPPYVRTQNIGSQRAQIISDQFGLSGRVDLYHAFVVGFSRVLDVGGIAGIIVSNRFLSTQSGASIRKTIIDKFKVIHIWDLGDTKLFEAAVLPAVLLLKKENSRNNNNYIKPKFTTIYSTKEKTNQLKSESIFSALNKSGLISIKNENYKIQNGYIDYNSEKSTVWRMSNGATEDWLDTVNKNTYCTFGDIGKIRVGVKTCADKVFIRSDWNEIPILERPEQELLKPLITHHISSRYNISSIIRKILYPHISENNNRKTVDINKYPSALNYLEKHRKLLENRKYVIEAKRKWYEIWVPQNPSLWKKPKIVFRDIAETPSFWLDLSGAVVNGDCYWFISDNKNNEDCLWLALAIGNSEFILDFYDHKFNNKLYAGRRRFITQYVKYFPIINPEENISKKIIQIVKDIYYSSSTLHQDEKERELNKLVWKGFGLARKETTG